MLSQTDPVLHVPARLQKISICESSQTLFQKCSFHIFVEYLIMLKTGRTAEFTHTISCVTQITPVTLLATLETWTQRKLKQTLILFKKFCKSKNALCILVCLGKSHRQ